MKNTIEETKEDNQFIDFSSAQEYSNNEKLVKQWTFEEKEEKTNKIKSINKITLTEDRLILSQNKENLSYRKFSYNLDDIRAVNYKTNQEKTTPAFNPIFVIIAIVLFVLGITYIAMNLIVVGIIFMVAALASVLFMVLKNKNSVNYFRKLIITIEKLNNTENIDIIEGSSNKFNLPVNGGKVITDELSFEITKEVIEMVLELDNLIVDIQKQKNIKTDKKKKE